MSKRNISIGLLLLTLAALAVHGYHPYAEDAEIYLPGIKKLLHPALYSSGTEFFESHASLTFFPNLIAASVRLTHIPFDYAIFIWYLASIFLLLLACWEFAGICFDSIRARWGAVALIASLLTLPVAGTALYLMDQYLNPRNLAAFAAVFAVTRVLEKKYARAAGWIVFAAVVHPLMASFALAFCVVLIFLDKVRKPALAMVAVFPFANFFAAPTPAYREAMRFHISHFLPQWQWYEWLGLIAPFAVLMGIARLARLRKLKNLERICHAAVVYELVYFVIALVIAIPQRFEALARLQPLRSLHLVYMFMLMAIGGLVAQYILRDRLWRWLVLFLPLCAGMFLAQRQLFASTAHIEWPWAAPRNPWEQAFRWIRHNTPMDAQFAIDPFYMEAPGEDRIGFRALAERSRLADANKDSGAVAMFPPLAEEWWEQFQAQKNWQHFTRADFLKLQEKYQVGWTVLEAPAIPGLKCPYTNQRLAVCRIER
ncbi:MAG TPA: hypothetical protein VHV29_09230 [Terriglobales bacterium]|nr:hypothetical protein [Terriglobales bacterium]